MVQTAQAQQTVVQNSHHQPATVANCLIQHLVDLGVHQAFGVSGGGIAHVFDSISRSPVELFHFRHESGAAFGAAEASLASGRPALVFATTGPGLMNALTGLTAARWDGARVIFISGATSPAQRGRWATQETSTYTLPQAGLFSDGGLFDFAIRIESPLELSVVGRRLAAGLSRPGGFVAHISLPLAIQQAPTRELTGSKDLGKASPAGDVSWCARALKSDGFAIWAGFGAIQAAPRVRELVERSGARIFCSPRAKGIVSEHHPNFVGVTGVGGYGGVIESLEDDRPAWILVLGSRLGEITSCWDPAYMPARGFIQVDIDPEVPGVAYPNTHTVAVLAEIGRFLSGLVKLFPKRKSLTVQRHPSWPKPSPIVPDRVRIDNLRIDKVQIHPLDLMSAVQKRVVEGSDALVMSDCGKSFAWCNHHLRFSEAGRYRSSPLYASMGHFAAGVVGAALARHGKAVVLVGNGSMLTSSELSTAVEYRAPAVWIVLNDGGPRSCPSRHGASGVDATNLALPAVDFVMLAKSMGGDGTVVEHRTQLAGALDRAMAAAGPFVVDVHMDTTQPVPSEGSLRDSEMPPVAATGDSACVRVGVAT